MVILRSVIENVRILYSFFSSVSNIIQSKCASGSSGQSYFENSFQTDYNSYFVNFILGKVLGNSSKWKCKDWDRREKWWKPRGHPRGSARPCPEPMNEIGRWAYTYNAITPILLLLYALFWCFSLMFCMIWIQPLFWLCMTGVVPWPAVWDGTVSSPAADPHHCPGRRYRGPHV